MKALRIVDWEGHYETSESKRITRLRWVPTPNGHDSPMYRRLLKHPNGMAHYGAWNLILQTASKCSPRGSLLFGPIGHREAHTAESIADVTGGNQKVIAEAIVRLLQIGWLEEVVVDAQQTAGRALQTAGLATTTGQDRTGQDRTGDGNTRARPEPPPDDGMFDQPTGRSKPMGVRSFPDWRIMVGKRIFFNREESGEWRALFEAEGWDEMTRGYEHLAQKKPEPGKIFLSDFQGIR